MKQSTCPRDGEPLRPLQMHGQQLEQCDRCAGLFISSSALVSVAPNHWAALVGGLDCADTAGLCCPVDGSPLAQLTYRSIELDACATCRGVWFDGGELLRVLSLDKSRRPSSRDDRLDKAEAAVDVADVSIDTVIEAIGNLFD